jgi:CheY-like chemotaxis protein
VAVERHPARASGGKVLVVDDEADPLGVAVTYLEETGYTAFQAMDGASALALIEHEKDIVLVITDVIMPGGMNGRQLVDEALKRRPQLKALFTSGYTENAILHHGRLDAGVLLLAKPYRKPELARMLRVALGG